MICLDMINDEQLMMLFSKDPETLESLCMIATLQIYFKENSGTNMLAS